MQILKGLRLHVVPRRAMTCGDPFSRSAESIINLEASLINQSIERFGERSEQVSIPSVPTAEDRKNPADNKQKLKQASETQP
jgi:hypothetical protein